MGSGWYLVLANAEKIRKKNTRNTSKRFCMTRNISRVGGVPCVSSHAVVKESSRVLCRRIPSSASHQVFDCTQRLNSSARAHSAAVEGGGGTGKIEAALQR